MPLDYATRTYSGLAVMPLYRPEMALSLPVNLAPSLTFPRGQVLAQYSTAANDVQTLTVTGTPTSGSLTINAVHPVTGATGTFVVAFDSTNAQAQTAIRALLGSHITVTGGPLPGTALVFTASGSFVSMPLDLMTVATNALAGGTTPAGAIVHTTTGRTLGTWGKYVDTTLDPAKCILQYDCVTDGGGLITFGTSGGGGFNGEEVFDAPAWFTGFFATSELTGLDAAGVTDLGRLLSGTVANGILSMR